jgi:hypothetical protein
MTRRIVNPPGAFPSRCVSSAAPMLPLSESKSSLVLDELIVDALSDQ